MGRGGARTGNGDLPEHAAVGSRFAAPLGVGRSETTTFLRVLCHELRAPITSVRALAGALSGSTAALDADQRVAAARLILDHAEHLASMLDAVRVVAEHLPATARSRRPAVARLADVVAGAADAAGVAVLRVDIAPAAGDVLLDAPSVRRILTNLLENARRHGRAPIGLSGTRGGRDLRLVVTDSGPGVPSEVVARALRGDAVPVEGPAGLGLWIVAQLVAMLGGTIAVGANQPHGARIEIVLPLPA